MSHKVLICCPFYGLSEETIRNSIQQAKEAYLAMRPSIDINTIIFRSVLSCGKPIETVKNERVWYISEMTELMSQCDEVFYCRGWMMARECKLLHDVAISCGVPYTRINGLDAMGWEED